MANYYKQIVLEKGRGAPRSKEVIYSFLIGETFNKDMIIELFIFFKARF